MDSKTTVISRNVIDNNGQNSAQQASVSQSAIAVTELLASIRTDSEKQSQEYLHDSIAPFGGE